MGQGPSRPGDDVGPQATRASSKLKQRLQVLEALVQGTPKHKKKELLRELATSNGSQPAVYGILPRAPEEFKLGALIAAGSYGRVYAGTYCGQPAALKLLILDEESAAAILNEVRLSLKLSHRNLVRLLDCAVVSTSSRQFSINSSLDGAPAGWLYSSEQQGYSYHPMLTGEQQQPCAPCSPAASSSSDQQQQGFREIARATDHSSHTTGTELLHLDGRGLGLTTPSGHACFEVWIAMELCDGGTLAEQVGRGFQYCPNSNQVDLELLLTIALDITRALSYMHAEHVCHGDLKAENVLLKVLHDRAGFDGDSTSDCSWLQLLCHSSSNSSILTRSRRCSSDTCWSFCRSSSGKGGAHTSTSSSSRSPSPDRDRSARNGRHRSSGHVLSLSGLCCLASTGSGLCEDLGMIGDQGVSEVLCSPGCLTHVVDPVAADVVQLQQEADVSGSSLESCSSDVTAATQQQVHTADTVAAADMEQDLPAARTALLAPLQPADSNELCEYTPSDDLNNLQLPTRRTSSGSQHAAEDATEEEHVAPLSLYTVNREHRRSRRLSRTGVLPNVQAALAAAAAAGRLDPSLYPSRLLASGSASGSSNSGDANAQSSSDDDKEMPSKDSTPLRLLQSDKQQQQQAQQGSLFSSAASDDVASDQYPSSSSNGQTTAARSNASPHRSGGLLGGLATAQAAYGQRSHGRSRRHSYCYGTTSANYDAMCLSGASNPAADASLLRQQYTHAGVSAAEAAAAIAAAAEAAREELQAARLLKLARSLAEQKDRGRRHRNRRMSCDDQLLLHLSSAHAAAEACQYQPDRVDVRVPVSGLGRLPLAVRWAGSTGAEIEGPCSVPGKPRGRTRRHSWTAAYLGDAMDTASAALKGYGLAGRSVVIEQQEDFVEAPADCTDSVIQQLLPLDAASSNSDRFAGAEQRLKISTANSRSGGRMRRARRHSWAGFKTEQQALAAAALGSAGKGRGIGRLSSCFTLSEPVIEGLDAASPRKGAFHLPSCVSCCTDSSYLPLDEADAEAQQSLLSASQTPSAESPDASSPLSAEAMNVGCLGRFSARSSSSRSHRKRRSSWCCGSTQGDVSLGTWSVHSSRSSSAELLPPGLFRPSASPLPISVSLSDHATASKGRRSTALGRRNSWNGADTHHPLFSSHEAGAVAMTSTVDESGGCQRCSVYSSSDPVHAQQQTGLQPAGTLQDAVAAATVLQGSAGVQQQTQRNKVCTVAGHESTVTNVGHWQPTEYTLQQGQAETAAPATGCLPAHAVTSTAATNSQLAGGSGTVEAEMPGSGSAHAEGQELLINSAAECIVMHAATAADTSCPSRQLRQDLHHSRCLAVAQQMLQQTASPTAALAAEYTEHKQHAAVNSGQQLAPGREPALELFTGSFDFKPTDGSRHSSRRSSMLSCSTADLFQEQSIHSPLTSFDAIHTRSGTPVAVDSVAQLPKAVRPAAASTSQPAESKAASRAATLNPNKERRWSTGVAAHDLLLRQTALPKQLSATNGAKVRRASACIPGAFDDIFDAPSAAAAGAAGPLRGHEDGSPSGGLLSGPQRVNVLGMPRKPTVLGQRRMSYDTATGAYHMVSSPPVAAAAAAQPLNHPSQQLGIHPMQQQSIVEAKQKQHAVQSQDDQQQRRDAQQHMQRLVEALAKKGYGGLVLDSVNEPNDHQQLMPHQQPGELQSPPPPAPFLSAFAAAAGTADATSAQAFGTARRPPHCVPPAYSRPKYCAKVCDFGFSQCLRAGQSHCSTDAAGTITHQAPEVIKSGYLSPAADIYAFGIIMWELLTGERPFTGLLGGDVVYGVCETGLRPQFPLGAPEAYVTLAQQCWAENIADRPTAGQLLKRLNEMLYEVRRQRQLDSSSSAGCDCNCTKGRPSSRPRRHSMPVVGAGRKRRASRRLSLFLPFARQPVAVPEHEPLEQPAPLDSGGGAFSSTLSAAAGTGRTSTGAAAPAPADSSSGPCCSSGRGAAGMAAGSAALLAGASGSWSFEYGKVKAVRQPATAVVAPAAGSDEHVPAEESSSEWFQSFD